MRRLTRGMPGMLAAVLMLVARLIAPSMAMPGPADTADVVAAAALQTICHAGALDGATDKGQPPASGDCQLCPACQLVGQFALPAPAGGMIPMPSLPAAGVAAPLPPATGPPGRPRLAARPTGPPSRSV